MRLIDQNAPGEPIPLTQLTRGQRGRIAACHADGCCAATMAALGLDPDAIVSVCRHGDPCIVRLHTRCGGSCRIGLRGELTRSIMVHPATA